MRPVATRHVECPEVLLDLAMMLFQELGGLSTRLDSANLNNRHDDCLNDFVSVW